MNHETVEALEGLDLDELEQKTAAIAKNLRSAAESAERLQEALPDKDDAERIGTLHQSLKNSAGGAEELQEALPD